MTRDEIYSIVTTLVFTVLFISCVAFTIVRPTKLKFDIWRNIRYESSGICSSMSFLLIFLFGLRNVNSFAPEYMAAINFVTLITDTQWDATSAITTTAKIDLSKNRFDFKQHIKDAYKLIGLLLATSTLMLIVLAVPYDVSIRLAVFCFAFEVANFLMWPYYAVNGVIVQLQYSAGKATVVKLLANVVRFCISLLPTPFCTVFDQITSAGLQFMGYGVLSRKVRRMQRNG